MTTRTSAAALIAAAIVTLPTGAPGATIVIEAYDESGTLLSFDEFLDRTTVGNKGWRNDLTYRIADGTAVQHYPIYELSGAPAFDTSEPGMA